MVDTSRLATSHRSDAIEILWEFGGVGLWDVVLKNGDPFDPATTIRFSRLVPQMCGYGPSDPFPSTVAEWRALLHPDDVELNDAAIANATGYQNLFDFRYRLRGKDGSYRWLWSSGGTLVDECGRLIRACGTISNIQRLIDAEAEVESLRTAERDAERARRAEERLSALLANSSDVILVASRLGYITFESPTAATNWSYGAGRLLGTHVSTLLKPSDRESFAQLWQQLSKEPGATEKTELRILVSNGVALHHEIFIANLCDTPSIDGFVLTVRNIEPRRQFEKRLSQQAFYDALTSLPNRALLNDRLLQSLATAERNGSRIALIFIDLVGFKGVNDSLGHKAGDELLIQVANRLSACVRAADTVGRFGGDEFVMIANACTSEEAARKVARMVLAQFRAPFKINDDSISISCSVGVALSSKDVETAELLLRNADVAMYQAKTLGSSEIVVFDPAMHSEKIARINLEADLRKALANEELRLYYQPIVEIKTGLIRGFEALVRWLHPERGIIGPSEFIPIAEQNGLIIPIGRWVLEQGCRQMARWLATDPLMSDRLLSVNLSPRQFLLPDLDHQIAEILAGTGLPPSNLKLEITETAIMRDLEDAVETLTKLKVLGIRLAIDDFGTGYSSLAYLKVLPVDTIKIDRAFVRDIGNTLADGAIVSAVINLARTLQMSVTAEGVETVEQNRLLCGMGCKFGQGFLYARPMSAEAVATWMSVSIGAGLETVT